MNKRYRVLDCAAPLGDLGEHLCTATTPEDAVWVTLGVRLMRRGRTEHLRAKVYFQAEDGTVTMVRLYTQAAERH